MGLANPVDRRSAAKAARGDRVYPTSGHNSVSSVGRSGTGTHGQIPMRMAGTIGGNGMVAHPRPGSSVPS